MNKREYDEIREKYKVPLTYEEMKEKTNDCHHPDTLNNLEATIIYIIVMIVGAIFNDRIGIWILASIIYFNYIE